MSQSLANLYVHLIFSTKERVPFLSPEVRPELHAYMATVLANLNSPAVIINSVADHVHLLFKMGRTVTLAQVVEDVKKSSSKWIKTQGEGFAGFAWQAGYGAFSVSESNVSNHIRGQEEHHWVKTFQEEYRVFLKRHRMEWDRGMCGIRSPFQGSSWVLEVGEPRAMPWATVGRPRWGWRLRWW